MLLAFFRRQPFRLFRYFILTLMLSIMDVGLAYIMAKCIELASDIQLEQSVHYGLIFLFYVVFYILVDYCSRHQKLRILQCSQSTLRDDLLERIFSIPVHEFHQKNSADWISALVNDLGIIEESYFQTILNLLSDLITFLISFVCLCLLSPWMAAFVVVFAVLQLTIPKFMAPRIGTAKAEVSKYAAAFTVAASEHLQGYDLIKSLQLVHQSLQSLEQANHTWEAKKFHSKFLSSIATLLSFGFSQVICVGIYFFGALLVASGFMTLPEMIAAAQLSVYIAAPLETLSGDIAEIAGSKEVIAALRKIGSAGTLEQSGAALRPPYTELSVRNLSFSYPDTQVLEDASYTFQQGGKYLLLGASGSGKTTLASLLTGALSPDKGTVCMAGTDISKISAGDYAKIITVCSQNNFIFNDTLRNNVTLFSNEYTDGEIRDVLYQVGFGYVLERFEHGLDEPLKQAGQNLSGGERQRIGLARIELLKTPYVILDESFSNLDYETMKKLTARLLSDPNRTILLIAHQLPQDIQAQFQTVLRIENKKIVEVPNQ